MEILGTFNEKFMPSQNLKSPNYAPFLKTVQNTTYHMILVGSIIFEHKSFHSSNIDVIVKFYQISSLLLFQLSGIFWLFPFR